MMEKVDGESEAVHRPLFFPAGWRSRFFRKADVAHTSYMLLLLRRSTSNFPVGVTSAKSLVYSALPSHLLYCPNCCGSLP